MKKFFYIILSLGITALSYFQCKAQPTQQTVNDGNINQLIDELILPGAYQFDAYLPLLQGKRVALLGNQTSEVNGALLPDILKDKGVNLVKLFSPEHGFRGTADAGAKVKSGYDEQTGLPIVSLYGKNKEISKEHLMDIDVLIYDLQDVGVRFYTYISTLEYAMKACAAYGKQLIILDRPNPLVKIVDGPVLEPAYKSFVGMQPIPIIYGMTAGEYALMLLGEKWIKSDNLNIKVIQVKNYDRSTSKYQIPVAPSPNLKNMAAIYLYPSLCLFEGTDISLGRGTDFPFQQYGHPSLKGYSYSFTPQSVVGATNPPQLNKRCYGRFITDNVDSAYLIASKGINLTYIINAYKNFPAKDKFFNAFFEKLAGNAQLRQQIIKGMSSEEIKKTWQPDLVKFNKIRSKYLLY